MRKPGSNRADTFRAISAAAVDLFFQNGFSATSTRELAARAGIEEGTLYYYIIGKEDLLFRIISDSYASYLEGFTQALAEGGPEDQLRRFVHHHIVTLIRNNKPSVLGYSERRSLSPAHLKKLLTIERSIIERVKDLVDRGIVSKVFHVRDTRVATFAVFHILNGTGGWFPLAGTRTDDAIVDDYTQFVFRILGADDSKVRPFREGSNVRQSSFQRDEAG